MGDLLRSGQRRSARLCAQHGRVARLAQDPAVGCHTLRLVGLGGGVGAKLILRDHGKAAHQIHRLGRTVHRHIDGLTGGTAVVRLRGLGRRGGAVTLRRGFGRGGRGLLRCGGGRCLELLHRHRLLRQAALGTLVQVRLGCSGGACHIGQARQHLVGAGQQTVCEGLQVAGLLGQIRCLGGKITGCAAVLFGSLNGGALLRVMLHTGLNERLHGRHRLALALVLRRRQQRILRRCDG